MQRNKRDKRFDPPRISHSTDLVNMQGETHAHPCVKMEFTNYRVESHENPGNTFFPVKELLRMEGLLDAPEDHPDVLRLTKYPIEEYKTFVHLYHGPADVIPASEIGDYPVFGSLHPDILAEIMANRMDVVLLGENGSIYSPRGCSHSFNFYDLRRTYDDGRPCDKYVWPGPRIDTFIGNTGPVRTAGGKEYLEPEGMVVGRWPADDYNPRPEEAKFLEKGNRNPRGIGRNGRGVVIAFTNGMYDRFINTFRHMLADRDEERTVEVDGKEVTAIVRVESPHKSWLRYCHFSYMDAKRSNAREDDHASESTSNPPTGAEEDQAEGSDAPADSDHGAPGANGAGDDPPAAEEPAAEESSTAATN